MIERKAIPSSCSDVEKQCKSQWPSHLQGLFWVALAIGLLFRLIGLHYPPYDSHSFRQCQTLSTIDDFYRHGIDLLHPHTLYMGYPGVFVLELPLFQAIGAVLYHVFGAHVEIIRVLNILFGLGSAGIVYLLTARWVDRATAVLATSIYWLAPLNILYHRSTLLDPMAVLCALISFWSLTTLLDPGARPAGTTIRNSLPNSQEIGTITPPCLCFSIFVVATLLTALIKALYLWPAVLLFGQAVLTRRFQFNLSLFGIVSAFAVAGVCFVCWNRYAAHVNAMNTLTGGIDPTSLLGITELFDKHFYSIMLKTRPKAWLGVVGAVFYLLGMWSWWVERQEAGWRSGLFLILIVPPTYLLVFSNINFPHDYYQLIITPFLAITSATGICWVANRLQNAYSASTAQQFLTAAGCLLVIAGATTYLIWFKWPRLDTRILAFENLCAGKFEPWAPAILWSTPDTTGQATNSYLPGFLYAGRLWGYGWTIPDAASARDIFRNTCRGFDRLDYVIFYGTEEPTWLSREEFRLAIRDDEHRFFVFKANGKDTSGDKR